MAALAPWWFCCLTGRLGAERQTMKKDLLVETFLFDAAG